MATPPVRSLNFYPAAFVAMLCIAAFLRFWQLETAPVWMDEAFTVLISRLPLRALLLEPIDVHPPLFYLVQKGWDSIVPGPAHARVPAAAFGVVAVAVTMLMARDQFSRRAAIFAGALAALTTGLVYLGQDARMYSQLCALLAVATWGLAGLIAGGRMHRHTYPVLYIVGAAAAIYTQFISLPFLLATNIAWAAAWVLGGRDRGAGLRWLACNLLLLAIALPWLTRAWMAAEFFRMADEPAWIAAWYAQNAIGFPALPRLARAAASLALMIAVVQGALAGWRRNPAAALIVLGGVLLYPAIILMLNQHTPMLSSRIFSPMAPMLAILFGCSAARGGRLAYALAAAVLACMAWSTLVEHRGRTKYEDVPAALRFAARHNMAQAPVLTCGFFTAGSVWAAEPTRRTFVLRSGGVLRFDDHFLNAARKGIGWLLRADAAALDGVLGGGYAVTDGLAGLARQTDRLVVIVDPCRAGFDRSIARELAPFRLHPVASAAFPGGIDGRAVIQRGTTRVMLFEREPG